MKFRNIAVGIVVGGVIFAGGVAAVAWQKGLSIRETVELGAGVIASKASRHTIADRTAAILAKKPQLKGVAESCEYSSSRTSDLSKSMRLAGKPRASIR